MTEQLHAQQLAEVMERMSDDEREHITQQLKAFVLHAKAKYGRFLCDFNKREYRYTVRAVKCRDLDKALRSFVKEKK